MSKQRNGKQGSFTAATDALHRQLIVKALQRGDTLKGTCKTLGISLSHIRNRMRDLGIQRKVTVTRTVDVKIVPVKSR